MFPSVICKIISEYVIDYKMNLLDWIDINKIDWIDINKIDWDALSFNPNAIKLLTANQDKINWHTLSCNPNIFTNNIKKYNDDVKNLQLILYNTKLEPKKYIPNEKEQTEQKKHNEKEQTEPKLEPKKHTKKEPKLNIFLINLTRYRNEVATKSIDIISTVYQTIHKQCFQR